MTLTAGLASAEEYETRTFTSREEFHSERQESGWQQTSCDNQGNCFTRFDTQLQSRDLHTYFEQSSNRPNLRTWRPR